MVIQDPLYSAAYSPAFRIIFSIIAVIAGVGVVAAMWSDDHSLGDVTYLVVVAFVGVLAVWLVLHLWRMRVDFHSAGVLSRGIAKSRWRSYSDIRAFDRQVERIIIHYEDGSRLNISRQMGNLTTISVLLSEKGVRNL